MSIHTDTNDIVEKDNPSWSGCNEKESWGECCLV